MNSNLRQLALSAAAAGGLAVSIWHFVPASPTASPATDLHARGNVDGPTPGASPLSLSESILTRDVSPASESGPHAPPRTSGESGRPPTATIPRETISTSVGAIKAQILNRSRSATALESENPIVEAPLRRLIIETAPPSALAGHAAVAGATPTFELQIDLAPGVKEPIALVGSSADLAPAQARALAAIANEFVDRIEQAAGTLSDEDFTATWAEEQANADAQYLAIFGAEAYNQKLAETAANAIAGKPVEGEAPAKQ